MTAQAETEVAEAAVAFYWARGHDRRDAELKLRAAVKALLAERAEEANAHGGIVS